MLQQTQVARVVPRYQAFLLDFPTAAACADAPVGAVVRAWAGLGYNRRAVHLHAAARAVVDRFGGELPTTLAELRSLPGVGPYTARAVLAFAYEADVGVVDTNAARVLARAVAGEKLAPARAQALADQMVPAGRGWAWNQAMLDLGATMCSRHRPRCGDCPLPGVGACAWARSAHAVPDPADGSAGVGGVQSTFAGSDRQGPGRLVDALRAGPVTTGALPEACGWPDDPDRAQRVAAGLVADGLAVADRGQLRLP
ncbi:MAG: A/G-specific adenine glycosylase, partial [Acidimicrobiia bacterium]|nr:A/G-specific adenine glycosylase [Acidimicrobiia bacterium]